MSRNRYKSGARKEYRVKKYLESQGFKVIRSAGSHGVWDLVGIKDGRIVLIQVKSKSSAREGLKQLLDFKEKKWIISQELWVVERIILRKVVREYQLGETD